MGLTVSYHHACRRDLSSGLGLPFPIIMACWPCHLERYFYCFRDGPCQLGRTSRSSDVCVLPFFPRYQHMLISCQNRTGKRFIHLPSPPDIVSLAGNCNLCADLLFDISPPDIMSLAGNCISYEGPFFNISPLCTAAVARSSEEDERSMADVRAEASVSYPIPPTNETGTGPVTKTALSLEVDRLFAMTVSPPWVKAHDYTSPGTPSSAFMGSSYPKSVEAKAAASSLSGGNFIVPSSWSNKPMRSGSVSIIDFRATSFRSPRLADRALPATR